MKVREALQLARLTLRASASVTTTIGYWGGMGAEAWLKPAEEPEVVQRWVVRWARKLQRVYGIQLATAGPEIAAGGIYPAKDGAGIGRMFVMNHRSAMDIPILLGLTHTRLMSRHDLAEWPLVGPAARRVGTLFVDRSSRNSGVAAMKQIGRELSKGRAVALFPEGTAHHGDEVRAFRPGAFQVARRSNAEVVPLGIAYADADAYFGDESFTSHLKRVASMPKLVAAIVAGEPIASGDQSTRELSQRVAQQVQELVIEARSLLP